MRGKVEIIWLEDNLKNREHISRIKSVREIIEKKGYDSNIEEISELETAKQMLTDPERRVDFFISDYNLGVGETGLEYLLEIRRKGLYKQFFILYSKNEYNEIRNGVIDKLKENNIELFCNFTFISLANSSPQMIKQEFSKAVDISLSRWDELNAIRGLYMCEHAELELLLREKYSCFDENKTYKDLFYRLKKSTTPAYLKRSKKIYEDWSELIEYRNLLAHTLEGYDIKSGFYIKSALNEQIIIYENQLDKYRLDLKNLKKKIIFLIINPNRPFPHEWH